MTSEAIQSDADKLHADAKKLAATGEFDRAMQYLHRALEFDPHHFPAFALLGKIFEHTGKTMEAMECYGRAIQLRPDLSEYKQRFLNLAEPMVLMEQNDALKALVLICMEDERLDFSKIGRLWYNIVIRDSALIAPKSFESLLDPFFITGLKRTLVYHPDFDLFVTRLRSELLLTENETMIELVRALSAYCQATDYVFYSAEHEKNKIETLRAQANLSQYQTAILECYASSKQPDIRTDIEPLTKITHDVSVLVQKQYEEFPYPRWAQINDFLEISEIGNLTLGEMKNILIAGCGTGREAIELAKTFPESNVLAVDLSLASLSYAKTKAQQLGIKNIEFRQGDILALGGIDRKFDFIACSGVLHHMEHPLDGWRALTSILSPDGFMRIALYSRTARRHLTQAKKVISKKGYTRDAESIRRFRHDAPGLFKRDVFASIKGFRDYYNLSECRDLLFHVQEHEFDPLDIKNMLEKLDLSFVQFNLPQDVLNKYTKKFPNDPEATNLKNWKLFEDKEPDTFKEMFQFWCRWKEA